MNQNIINQDMVDSAIVIQNSSPFTTAVGYQALAANLTGTDNTAIGYQALSLNTQGNANTAVGVGALANNTNKDMSTAVGYQALNRNTGEGNTAVGYSALSSITTAGGCTAVGQSALFSATGQDNTAIGASALRLVAGGFGNTAIGHTAASAVTSTTSYSISIGPYVSGGHNAINIGTQNVQTACFIAGITGVQLAGPAVFVESGNGRLGQLVSSLRYKRDVMNMDLSISEKLLHLRPVSFYYKQQTDERRQYGLIAEEVQSLIPEIVTQDHQGNPESVQYHVLPAMLLQLLQEQQRLIYRLKERCDQFSRKYASNQIKK